MPNLRLAIAYTTDHRNSEAVVLAGGFDQEKLQAAVNAAGPQFQRFEFGIFTFQRSAARTAAALPAASLPVAAPSVPTFEDVVAKGYSPIAAILIVAGETKALELAGLAENERNALVSEEIEALRTALAKELGAHNQELIDNHAMAVAENEKLRADLAAAQELLAAQNSTPAPVSGAGETSVEPASDTSQPAPAAEPQDPAAGGPEASAAGPQLAPESAPADAPKHRRR